METTMYNEYGSSNVSQLKQEENGIQKGNESETAFAELERGVHAALETYSNVHRGSGHNSMVSSHLYEHARDIVLEYMGLNKERYIVIFCSSKRTNDLTSQLKSGSYQFLTSQEVGLPLGITAVIVGKKRYLKADHQNVVVEQPDLLLQTG